MRRVIGVAVLLLAAVPGCISSTDSQEKEPFTEARWKEMVVENGQRLTTEDQRKKESKFHPLMAAAGKVWETMGQVYDYFARNTPFDAAKNMLDPAYPDRRRIAVIYLSEREFGRQEPYTRYYMEMAAGDNQPLVRAMALRALNRARHKDAIPVIVRLLEDPSDLVKLEAAKALANMPDPSAVEPLIRHLDNVDESLDVRIACADALRSFRTSPAAQALVRNLRDRQFGVAWQARKSLNLMTGKDYRYDQAAWLEFLSGSGSPVG